MVNHTNHHQDQDNKKVVIEWLQLLRNVIYDEFLKIEQEFALVTGVQPATFTTSTWNREGGGGGVMAIMHGNVFEKVGVNISTVHGHFSEEFRTKIPGTHSDSSFFATGVSVVAHMCSPLTPAFHFNSRYIETQKKWFGGGGDLTPIYADHDETDHFHQSLKKACDQHNLSYYPLFKQQCDEYFYLHHRKEPRGVGGIFYDYLSNKFEDDLRFVQDVGQAILATYPQIVRNKMYLPWTAEQRNYQLIKRGRYVEFNLLYDRGTAFGLATGGNVEAILMSLPPEVKWP